MNPKNSRVMAQAKVLFVMWISKKGRNWKCESLANHESRKIALVASWLAGRLTMLQRSPCGFLSDGICQEVCHHLSQVTAGGISVIHQSTTLQGCH